MAPHGQSTTGQQGHWPLTATIDWCESNYQFSYYIAEFWNTLSNLAFVIPQLVQYVSLSRHKSIEHTFRSAFLSLALVGIGSFCFHMTLARSMQMFDETSMILVSLHGFYLLYIIKSPNVNRRLLATLLFCYGAVFLALYLFLVAWPVFHHTAFALLVYASIAIGYQLNRRYGPRYKFWTVLIVQHIAFAFWLIDKHYCDLLTTFRENHVPILLRPAFEFHAVWHLLMGLASHLFVCGIIRLRALTKYKEEFVIVPKWLGLLIVLEKVEQHENLPLRKENFNAQVYHKDLRSRKLPDSKMSKSYNHNNNNENVFDLHVIQS